MFNFIQGARVAQMAFVVNNLEEVKSGFSNLFGFTPVPPTCGLGNPEVARTEFRGKLSPEIECKIVYFDFENIQIELMQPNENPSTWREWLEQRGEGLHHISFLVHDMDARIKDCEKKGMTMVQRGEYADASGCYAYLEAPGTVNFLIELLEDYKKRDA